MKPIWKFRLLALTLIVLVGGFSISVLASVVVQTPPPSLPSGEAKVITPQLVAAAKLASNIAPFRTDLKASYAIALADQTLQSAGGQPSDDHAAQNAVMSALKSGPHDARMWLVFALLRARKDPGDALAAESLKMSYLTGPSQAGLIPIRLESVTAGNALYDADLAELARGDVRAVLMQYPDQRQALINDYVRASVVGKTFLEAAIKMIDPTLAASLPAAK